MMFCDRHRRIRAYFVWLSAPSPRFNFSSEKFKFMLIARNAVYFRSRSRISYRARTGWSEKTERRGLRNFPRKLATEQADERQADGRDATSVRAISQQTVAVGPRAAPSQSLTRIFRALLPRSPAENTKTNESAASFKLEKVLALLCYSN